MFEENIEWLDLIILYVNPRIMPGSS